MKKLLLLALVTLMLTSCKKRVDDFSRPCSDFLIYSYFVNEGFDATGDDFEDPYVKYIVDSIRYQVISPVDTSDLLVPKIDRSGINKFTFNYRFSSNLISDKTGTYYFVILFNETESDTIKVVYQHGNIDYQVYHNNSLVENAPCGEEPKTLKILV